VKTFDELKIYPLKTLALEIKQEHENFEDYDPNLINLKINSWKTGITTLNEESLIPTIIKISKDAPMTELIRKLSILVNIPFEFLIVMKRNPKFTTSSVDVLSDEKSLDKKLSKLKINDGVNIFVED